MKSEKVQWLSAISWLRPKRGNEQLAWGSAPGIRGYGKRPTGAKALLFFMLLPLQGVDNAHNLPRALLCAMCLLAFQAVVGCRRNIVKISQQAEWHFSFFTFRSLPSIASHFTLQVLGFTEKPSLRCNSSEGSFEQRRGLVVSITSPRTYSWNQYLEHEARKPGVSVSKKRSSDDKPKIIHYICDDKIIYSKWWEKDGHIRS